MSDKEHKEGTTYLDDAVDNLQYCLSGLSAASRKAVMGALKAAPIGKIFYVTGGLLTTGAHLLLPLRVISKGEDDVFVRPPLR